MKYGENYTLKYISKENGELLFDVIDETGENIVLNGTMQDLKKILYFSNGLTIELPFKSLQDAIFNSPIVFIAKRKPIKRMDELDFNLWNPYFFKIGCLTMIRDKKISFRVTESEYKEIMRNKPHFESLSEYIRRLLIGQ